MFQEEIDEIKRKKTIAQNKLKVFNLDDFQVNNFIESDDGNEIRKLELEIDYCDLRSNINKMEFNNRKVLSSIEKSTKNIKLLNECLSEKVNVGEIKEASEKRQILIHKLKSKEFPDDHPILKIIHKLKELD